MADTDTSSTLIFDEVDAGIGGEVAEMVGKKLAELARLHQVVCITHLAQIAKFGDHHHKISKETRARRTRTLIQELSHEDRVEETARMISGAEITQTTRQHAREMLSDRQTSANAN
jgi:DNA repair protein RecN (Recombination protein N)